MTLINMSKTIFTILGLIFINLGLSQTKFINLDSPHLIKFEIQKNGIGEDQFNNLIKQLESDVLNTQFTMLDADKLVFSRKLVDQTRLNTIQNNLQAQIDVFGARIEFANQNQTSEVFFNEKVLISTFYVTDLNNAIDEIEIESFLLNEKKVCFVNADYLTHQVYVVYDINLGEEIVREILISQNKRVIQSDEISKYY